MKNILRSLFLAFIIFSSFYQSSAKGIKFGKISKDEFALKECAYEKEAAAVVLSRTCTIDVNYNVITYSYHVRVKILKEEGIDQANIKLSYYRKDNTENITRIKGHTINLNSNGKQEVVDLDKNSVFDVDVNENYGEIRFSMPDVKVGSIIEYKYVTNSQFFSYLDTWYFQDEIPTLYSSLKVLMSESLQYNMVMFGNRLKAKYSDTKSDEWILTNMPSIKDESYVNNYLDFVEQLRFQLAGYYTKDKSSIAGGLNFVNSMTTYEKLAEEYIDRVLFLGRTNFAKKQLETILTGDENNWEKLEKVYDFVRSNVKWNGKYRLYPEKSPPKLLEEKVGSNSEINFLLVLMLQEAGFDCNPALARSNERGLIQKTYPLLSQFNQILACVELYGKRIFLNATSPYRPFDLIAENDLNYHAFVLKKGKPYWAKLKPNEKNHQDIMITYNYSDLESPACKLVVRETGYLAANSRKTLAESGVESWMSELFDLEQFNFQKDSIDIINSDNLSLALKMKCDLKLENGLGDEDFIYVNLFNGNDLKNPFLKETRQYRIDYNYPRSKTYLLKFILPEGYEFEEYPKAKKISMVQKIAEFTFASKVMGRELTVRTSFSINIASFSKEYYEELRELYSQMIKVMGSQVVIKKDQNISKK